MTNNNMYDVDEHVNKDVLRSIAAQKFKKHCKIMLLIIEQFNSDTVRKSDLKRFVEKSHNFANNVQFNLFD